MNEELDLIEQLARACLEPNTVPQHRTLARSFRQHLGPSEALRMTALIRNQRDALIQADLKIRSFPGTDQGDVAFIREVLG